MRKLKGLEDAELWGGGEAVWEVWHVVMAEKNVSVTPVVC